MLNKSAGVRFKGGASRAIADALGNMSERPFMTALALGLPLSALGIVEGVADDVGDVVKDRYKAMNNPVWDAMGRSQLYGQYDPLQQFIKQREAIYELKYGMPQRLAERAAGDAINGIGGQIKGMIERGREGAAFDAISSSPQVQALGKAKAREIFDQVTALAPGVVTKAPGVALSVMDSSIASGSTALRPELATSLTSAAEKLAKL